ncbi:MAG TPA: hypothetical protein VFP40_00280 [Terriglobales bacterium]|nr:hypothetical protein [Terriglobales bacterium]
MHPRDRFAKVQDMIAALALIVIGCFCLIITLGVLPMDWLDILHAPLIQGLPLLLIGLGYVLLLLERTTSNRSLERGSR